MQLAFFSGQHSHDDIHVLARQLLVHSRGDDHHYLHAFLHAATVAVKDEIRALPHAVQALVPSFENVLDLVKHAPDLRDGPLAEPIDRVLLCVLKFGAMIGYVKRLKPWCTLGNLRQRLIRVMLGTMSSLQPHTTSTQLTPVFSAWALAS